MMTDLEAVCLMISVAGLAVVGPQFFEGLMDLLRNFLH